MLNLYLFTSSIADVIAFSTKNAVKSIVIFCKRYISVDDNIKIKQLMIKEFKLNWPQVHVLIRKLLLKARDLKVGSSSVSYREGGNVQIAPPFNFEEVTRSPESLVILVKRLVSCILFIFLFIFTAKFKYKWWRKKWNKLHKL